MNYYDYSDINFINFIKSTRYIFLLLIIIFYFTYYFKYIFINKLNNNKINNSFEKRNINKLRICICTLGKKENKYIREFTNHYKKYGIDKIFLYDNNDINDERFDDVISDYINNKYIEILNYRGKKAPQFQIYNDCYQKNNEQYDWLIFYDLDEYINLKYFKNIKQFLSEKKFNKCKIVYLNCIRHTDNDLLYYDNRSLTERFPIINWNSKMFTVKSILRGNIKNIIFKTTHWLDKTIKGCNSFGKKIKPNKKKKLNNDIKTFKDCYIDHYCFKSTEEYIDKINKGDAVFGKNNKTMLHKIRLYFEYNNITFEKIEYIEKELGLNLEEYKEIIKNKIKESKR
jgi:hypothetical protein